MTGFKGSDKITQYLGYFNAPGQTVYCTPHGLWGTVKDMLKLLDGSRYPHAKAKTEKEYNPTRWNWVGRFTKAMSADECDRINQLVRERFVRPGGTDPMRPPWAGTGGGTNAVTFKIWDAILMCSSYGVYIIEQCSSLSPGVKEMWGDLLYALELLTLKFYKVHTHYIII